jgi:hypothetical protein
MRRALEIGKPRGYTAFLLWRPEPLARLCSQALEAGIEPRYVAEIIRARGLRLDAARHPLADWPWPFRVHTLGRFRLEKGDREITFTGKGQRKPLELLKALVASGGRQVSDVNLAEAVWPRIEGDSAHRSFTTNLHRLRKLLGEDRALPLAEGKLSLDGGYVWVDVWAFERATSQVEQMLRAPRGRPDPERLAALRRSRAGALPGTFPRTRTRRALESRDARSAASPVRADHRRAVPSLGADGRGGARADLL